MLVPGPGISSRDMREGGGPGNRLTTISRECTGNENHLSRIDLKWRESNLSSLNFIFLNVIKRDCECFKGINPNL